MAKPKTGPLASVMVREPDGQKPFTAKLEDSPAALKLARIVAALLPPGAGERFLLATPAAWPQNVIGARADVGNCCACGEPVWLSPSSVRALNDGAMPIVCLACLEREADAKAKADEVRATKPAGA